MASSMTAVSEIKPMTTELGQPYDLSQLLKSMTWSISSVTETRLWHYTVGDVAFLGFLLVFLYRYVRLIVHVAVYYVFYKPAVPSVSPAFTGRDVTVIVPTVSPQNANFLECVRTCAANSPRRIIVVTVGELLEQNVKDVAAQALESRDHDFEFLVHNVDHASKRRQLGKGIREVETAITVLVDDSVIWRPNFLTSLLAPFEDLSVGFVGVGKTVTRDARAGWVASFWNIMGALYLERANFDYLAPNGIDGGVPVVSGRTSAIRTPIIKNDEFLRMFEDERFFFDLLPAVGEPGLNPDDDNALVSHGLAI
jgi:cellulose synthase/poly-beta-1,6-N-acetylglucosamine synthase-like glycosyltransferase